jgi:uncharacterized protein YbjT (DUF2867 family)
MIPPKPRILVTGGETFLGINIASALLAEGADVTLLVRPGREKTLGVLADRVRWYVADVWDPASLRGRARGHAWVINTVGSMVAEPSSGLTYHRLNVVSARNVANMCISDGVSNMLLFSVAGAPWINRQYIRAKREAETYLARIGLNGVIVRAPLVYVRGAPRPLFYRLASAVIGRPPLSWLGLGKWAPLPLDVVARGVARLVLRGPTRRINYAGDLRRLNTRDELRGVANVPPQVTQGLQMTTEGALPFDSIDDNAPFGWTN